MCTKGDSVLIVEEQHWWAHVILFLSVMGMKFGIMLRIICMHSTIPGMLKFIFPAMEQIGLSKGLMRFQKHNIIWINFTFIKA